MTLEATYSRTKQFFHFFSVMLIALTLLCLPYQIIETPFVQINIHDLAIPQPVKEIQEIKSKPVPLNKPLLYWHSMGRIGNRITEYTAAFCTAVLSNHTPSIQANSPLLLLFNINQIVKVTKHQQNQVRPVIAEKECCFWQPHILTNATKIKGEVELYGYLYSYKYMLPCWGQLRQELQLKDSIHELAIKNMVKALLNYLKSSNPETNNTSTALEVLKKGRLPTKIYTLIGVHIRRTDRPATYTPVTFFEKAFQYFETKFEHIIFFICSDDIKWAKKNLPGLSSNSSILLFMSDKINNYRVDFGILVSCNHSIITAGTFSWWSGWLTQGEVVYHTGFDRWKKAKYAHTYKKEDLYPEHWIPMD